MLTATAASQPASLVRLVGRLSTDWHKSNRVIVNWSKSKFIARRKFHRMQHTIDMALATLALASAFTRSAVPLSPYKAAPV